MTKRTLTLLVEVYDQEKAAWIWDLHAGSLEVTDLGIDVICIAEGDQIKDIEDDDEDEE